MILDLIPVQLSKSGQSIKFTTNGFQQYWIKVKSLNIRIFISEYEDWDNIYRVEFKRKDLELYCKNNFRIYKIVNIYKIYKIDIF